ncbi:30S ribosomal protein S16 [Buchnera aphidicola (Takecallis arundicolens)]|uniref:30S ribosomal protein S16 n=1 Tax=Buchnera aphidicola TaxID=9 RepID=UPI003463F3A6
MIKIRLSLQGTKKKPFYNIIVADSRSPRDGKFIEQLGFLNPNKSCKIQNMHLNIPRIQYWIKNGAIPTKKIKQLIKFTIQNKI